MNLISLFPKQDLRQPMIFVLFLTICAIGQIHGQTTRLVDANTGSDVGDCSGAPCLTISYAVAQSNPGDDILIDDGTYNENITVDKNDLLFHSVNGAGAVTIQGSYAPGGPTGTFFIDNVTGTTIGDLNEGLTIIGYDSPAPGIEEAAIYARGDLVNYDGTRQCDYR